MQVWILTFNRPIALNRQINAFRDWAEVHIFSNHPQIGLSTENNQLYEQGKLHILSNSLSDPEATSYCARSWNNMFLKCFKDQEEAIFIQDDTQIWNPNAFKDLILKHKETYDLIWGPAGDQFFYMKKSVLQQVGWFDERYLGCYCGDADWLKRAWRALDKNRLSVVDTHDWGFVHNDIGICHYIPTDVGSKAADPNYVNQHQEAEAKLGQENTALIQSQSHFKAKWGTPGNGINGIGSMIHHINPPTFPEIDWYPWFTKKYLKGEQDGRNAIPATTVTILE
jgi:hypothetical protein